MHYGKMSGPAWLRVGAGGALLGVPSSANVGPNHFQVAVSDQFGATGSASLVIYVLPGRAPVFTGIDATSFPDIGLSLSCADGQQYVVQSAEAIAGPWQNVGTNGTGVSPFNLSARTAQEETNRFYRAVIP
jgi:hypothetical protein